MTATEQKYMAILWKINYMHLDAPLLVDDRKFIDF